MNGKAINRNLLLPVFILALLSQPVHSTVLYVNANVQGGNQDGTSWANAYPLLQSSIIAAQYGDTIWVAQGTYLPTTGTNRNISFTLKNGVKMFGGFAGAETALVERDWETNATILSGDIGVPGDSTDNCYTVVYCQFADSTTVLDGFVITGGNADSQVALEPANGRTKSGGGMYLVSFLPAADNRLAIVNCKFIKNYAVVNGGAIYMNSSASGSVTPRIENSRFEHNAAFNGGGIYKASSSMAYDMLISGCHFWQNWAKFGSGIQYQNNYGNKDLVIRDCDFLKNFNVADGTVHQEVNNSSGTLKAIHCTFEENIAGGIGSSIYCFLNVPSPELEVDSCIFRSNLSGEGTVSIFGFNDGFAEIKNSKFINNQGFQAVCLYAPGTLLAVKNCNFSSSHYPYPDGPKVGVAFTFYLGSSTLPASRFTNCTFYDNHGTETGTISSSSILNIENCIFSKNDLSQNGKLIKYVGNNLNISHSLADVSGCNAIADSNFTCGPGMLYLQDPLFADTAASDFTLLPCSPAINAGDNAIVDSLGILTDLAGNPRILGGTVDMGAYEAPALSVDTSLIALPSCGGTANGAVQFQLAHGC
ncbi:MAG: hypothetical protein EPO28_03210, partial [Saprospiraceae bacterium]